MSLIQRCLRQPRSIYALNDALIEKIAAENSFVHKRAAKQLRLWNMVMWSCDRMPSCMAVLIFFWLAELHEGVRLMIKKAEVGTELADHMPSFFRFCTTLINHIASQSITEKSAPRRALLFYVALGYVVDYSRIDIIDATPSLMQEKVPKHKKDALIALWRGRQLKKGRQIDEGLAATTSVK